MYWYGSNKTEELDVQLTNDNLVMSKPISNLPQKTADQGKLYLRMQLWWYM